MKYRLAGASYRTIAEKLTEERAQAYADERGVSFERAMRKITHVSKRTAWDDVTAELEELRRRDGDAARGPDGARERPVGSGVLEGAVAVREWQRAGWPTGYRDDGTALPDRCRYAPRSDPVSRHAAHASYAGSLSGVSLSQGRGVSVIRRAPLLSKPRTWRRRRRPRPPSAARRLPTAAPLNRAARDGETRRRLAAGESVRVVARALRPGDRALAPEADLPETADLPAGGPGAVGTVDRRVRVTAARRRLRG